MTAESSAYDPPATSGSSIIRRVARVVTAILALVLLALIATGAWFYVRLRGSLPQLEGKLVLTGLSRPVTVERDNLGVPTIVGDSRNDVARALGFVHGQDRFFQMDLSRRRGAGELAELVGASGLRADRLCRRADQLHYLGSAAWFQECDPAHDDEDQ